MDQIASHRNRNKIGITSLSLFLSPGRKGSPPDTTQLFHPPGQDNVLFSTTLSMWYIDNDVDQLIIRHYNYETNGTDTKRD